MATVSENGLVTGVNRGTATVTATAGGKSATCQVTVTWEVQSVTVSPATLTMTKVGETVQLTATVAPEGAGEAVWSSSDEAVATVSSEGLVTAVGQGNAIITATAGEKTATCEVTVEISIVEVEDGQATVQLGEVRRKNWPRLSAKPPRKVSPVSCLSATIREWDDGRPIYSMASRRK